LLGNSCVIVRSKNLTLGNFLMDRNIALSYSKTVKNKTDYKIKQESSSEFTSTYMSSNELYLNIMHRVSYNNHLNMSCIIIINICLCTILHLHLPMPTCRVTTFPSVSELKLVNPPYFFNVHSVSFPVSNGILGFVIFGLFVIFFLVNRNPEPPDTCKETTEYGKFVIIIHI